ncbi:MAG: dihydropteroate synthase [Alistipes sp.]|nr:dihydropteroate synthase [Alistipes sp.]
MAIVNVTADSFYEGSRVTDVEAVESRIAEAVAAGATIIDIGGYSSRPGADDIPMEQEWSRVDMGVGAARRVAAGVAVSVDTFRAEIVRRTVAKYGVVIVNDITAGEGDSRMFDTVAELGVPYVAMHMRGTPQTMQSKTEYKDVVTEVVEYLSTRATELQRRGVKRENIILDPGFGFAKSVEQNYQLLAGLGRLCALGYAVLVGLSRKSMIYKVLNTTPQDALAGTTALNWEAINLGATILRVHDVEPAVQIVKIFREYTNDKGFGDL